MQPKKSTAQAIIERLLKRLESDNEPKHPGVIMEYPAKEYDPGGYADPMRDDRPDFVKRDDANFDGR